MDRGEETGIVSCEGAAEHSFEASFLCYLGEEQ